MIFIGFLQKMPSHERKSEQRSRTYFCTPLGLAGVKKMRRKYKENNFCCSLRWGNGEWRGEEGMRGSDVGVPAGEVLSIV